jgi:3'(2'), 5'-bisphosphate nucleotidase
MSIEIHLDQDHASASVLIEEAGGVITDVRGRRFDFGLGRTLGENSGMVAARKEIHAKVVEAVRQAIHDNAN